MPFLPISKQDMKDRGIDQLDFICITGDVCLKAAAVMSE